MLMKLTALAYQHKDLMQTEVVVQVVVLNIH